MRQNYFFEYVPNAYINLCVDKAQQMANNRFVYDFKAGDKEAVQICAEWLARYLTKQYSSILEDFVVVFAPCSTQWKYNKRFGYLAAILNAAGIATANEHVHIFGERKPTHNGGSHRTRQAQGSGEVGQQARHGQQSSHIQLHASADGRPQGGAGTRHIDEPKFQTHQERETERGRDNRDFSGYSYPHEGGSLERCNHHGIRAQSPIGQHAAKQGGRCADPADSQGLSSHAHLLYGPCDSNRWSILQLSRQGQTIGTMGNVTGTRCPFSFLQSC